MDGLSDTAGICIVGLMYTGRCVVKVLLLPYAVCMRQMSKGYFHQHVASWAQTKVLGQVAIDSEPVLDVLSISLQPENVLTDAFQASREDSFV